MWIALVVLLCVLAMPVAFADLELFTNNRAYSAGQPLFVFGQANPDEDIIIRVFGPDETVTRFDQITASSDGSFHWTILTWPKPSISFPYGTYTIEAISTDQDGLATSINVRFTETSELVDTPIERTLNLLIFAPETAAVNNTLRVFVQTTSDGLLVGSDPTDLLRTTHVHMPNGEVYDIGGSFRALHQGLFYADYTPDQVGTYVFHVVAFSQGAVSHASSSTIVQKLDIGGISEQIILLNTILAETSAELDQLKDEVGEFKSTLQQASDNIDTSVSAMSESVRNVEEASTQLNSLFLPVVALIGVIVALQIATLARARIR